MQDQTSAETLLVICCGNRSQCITFWKYSGMPKIYQTI